MSDTIRPPRSPYLRKRRMLPWAYTDDGQNPWKEDGGLSMEADHGLTAKRVRGIRKKAQALNKYQNGRARSYRKRQLHKQIQDELEQRRVDPGTQEHSV